GGVVVVVLGAGGFQGRLSTPSALIRKGNSSQAVLNLQPKPVIRAVAVPKNAGDTLKQNTPRHNAVMKLLRDGNRVSENDDNYCPALHNKEHMDWNRSLNIHPPTNQQALAEVVFIGAAPSTHPTLPTTEKVQIPVVAVSSKK
ncbi:hypothetical protein ACTHT5_11860, partial [Neisseria sp. P0022.S002]